MTTSSPVRLFHKRLDGTTDFCRLHLDGTMKAHRVDDKWEFVVLYKRKVVGCGEFTRIRDGEAWAIGLLRKARKDGLAKC